VLAFKGITAGGFSREASWRVAFGQRDLDPKGAGVWLSTFSSAGFYGEVAAFGRGSFWKGIAK